jgi:hypothetical protein
LPSSWRVPSVAAAINDAVLGAVRMQCAQCDLCHGGPARIRGLLVSARKERTMSTTPTLLVRRHAQPTPLACQGDGMIVIWRGLGIVAPLIPLAFWGGTQALVNALGGPESYEHHSGLWGPLAVALAAAPAFYRAGSGDQYWAVPLAALAAMAYWHRPYCYQPATPDAWWTQEHLDYARGIAFATLVPALPAHGRPAFLCGEHKKWISRRPVTGPVCSQSCGSMAICR